MLTCELDANLQAHAPALQAQLRSGLSDERRGALLEAIHWLYRSRSGDDLFFGPKRHARLAAYLGSEDGSARLARLAERVYQRGPWAALEAARQAREAEARRQTLKREQADLARRLQALEKAVRHWQVEAQNARYTLANAEANAHTLQADLGLVQAKLRELEGKLDLVGAA